MTKEAAADELARIESMGVRIIAQSEPAYPPLLTQIEDAPPLIHVLGNPEILAHPSIAVVGTRNASINGSRFAKKLTSDLGAAGFTVISGMARGIDAAAHEGALPTGTIAVLAGGVDVIYPKENTDLYKQIVETGAVISEMPPGMVPQARHFPRRNRLISGCARGVVVVEAARRSGSLITARMALEQNRDVFAVPGSPGDPRSGGTNHLLRQGAVLTESAEDVLTNIAAPSFHQNEISETLENAAPYNNLADEAERDVAHQDITRRLGAAPVTVDEIIRECHMSPALVSTVLLELELTGRLERHPGNRVSLINNE